MLERKRGPFMVAGAALALASCSALPSMRPSAAPAAEETVAARPAETPAGEAPAGEVPVVAAPAAETPPSPLAAALRNLRLGVDGMVEGAQAGVGHTFRQTLGRVGGRTIAASDACHSADEAEGCAIAARAACRRASFADGSPLASSSYVSCTGAWSMWAGSAPAGACKTKRRLNAALCW